MFLPAVKHCDWVRCVWGGVGGGDAQQSAILHGGGGEESVHWEERERLNQMLLWLWCLNHSTHTHWPREINRLLILSTHTHMNVHKKRRQKAIWVFLRTVFIPLPLSTLSFLTFLNRVQVLMRFGSVMTLRGEGQRRSGAAGGQWVTVHAWHPGQNRK